MRMGVLLRLRNTFVNIAWGQLYHTTTQPENRTHTIHGGQACIALHVTRVVHTDISSTSHMLSVRHNSAIQGSGGTFLSWHLSCASLSLCLFVNNTPQRFHLFHPPPPTSFTLTLPPSFIQCRGEQTTLCLRGSRCGLDHLAPMPANFTSILWP